MKYYVVWSGRTPGIYTSWSDCEAQVKGVEGSRYKSFKNQAEAEEAYLAGYESYVSKSTSETKININSTTITDVEGKGGIVRMPASPEVWKKIETEAIAVDAACSNNPGPMEYRGVYMRSGKEIFHFGPIQGTNNIGEFLGIVHALALLEQKGLEMTIYSDSVSAISWVRKRQCKTTLQHTPKTEKLFEMIARAEQWLRTHEWNSPIVKWNTEDWGEIPADFGRK